MDKQKNFGLCLYQKEKKEALVLKDLLQLLRTYAPTKASSFAYVSSESSLLPNLTLWENLKLETGGTDWSDFKKSLKPEWLSLVSLLKSPDQITQKSEPWEKFAVSLLKAVLGPSRHILIDMNEDHLSTFMVKALKNACCQAASTDKSITLASATSGLWLDCAHSIVKRNGYEFVTEELNIELLTRHWAA
jgi:hypothetical protein